jgi:4-amino-4-deoxy-L-arabinose transferase-like glycosyltransferase
MAGLYLLLGLVGRDPWKPEDAIHFGIVRDMLQGRGWLATHLAGDPYPPQPPLYYWLAAMFGRLFGWLLPLHDAVRLASAAVGGLYLWGIAAAARILFAPDMRAAAVVLALGCIGLIVPMHDTQPTLALPAAFAWAAYGLGRILERPGKGAAYLGWAIGLGFLAADIPALAMLVPLAVLLPLASGHWRKRDPLLGIGLGLAIAAAIAALWPLALWRWQPALLAAWWQDSAADLVLDARIWRRIGHLLVLLPWFAWPALPLLFWTLWRQRTALGSPGLAIGLVGFAVALLAAAITEGTRHMAALSLLPPLVLLATPAAGTLRRGAANLLDWFAMMAFSLFAALAWLGWIAMQIGWPEPVARQVARLAPDFVAQIQPLALTLAAALTIAWLWLMWSTPRSPYRGTMHWGAGLIVLWGLLTTLWLPAIDHARSYRSVSAELARALPAEPGCIARRDLGDAQRASFDYFDGIRTVAASSGEARGCRFMLVQVVGRSPPDTAPGPGWRKIWEGRRPGDRSEAFRLYRKG